MIRLFGLERGYPLVPLMAYTPYFLVLSLAAAAGAAALRRWVPAAIGTAAAITLGSLVIPRVIPDEDLSFSNGTELHILTVNLKRGDADLGAVVDLVRRERIDLLSVQELTPSAAKQLRDRGLADLLPFQSTSVRRDVYGGGLYARFALRSRGVVPGMFRQPRATLRLPGVGGVDVVSVHTAAPRYPSTEDWSEDLQALPKAEADGPLRLLAGDFNATLDHDLFRDLIDSGYRDAADADGDGLAPTWPTADRLLPPVTIDHLLADPRIDVSEYAVHDIPDSDHRALIASLSFPPGPADQRR